MKYQTGPISADFLGITCCMCGEKYSENYCRDSAGHPLYHNWNRAKPLDEQDFAAYFHGMLDIKFFCGPHCATKHYDHPDEILVPLAVLASKVQT